MTSMNNLLILTLLIIPFNVIAQPQTMNDLVNPIIEHLSWCESRHNNLAYNPADPILPSFGRFQFKKQTWNWALDRYNLFPYADEHDRENLLWDGQAQEKVVIEMLKEGRWEHWYNCLNKIYEI